MNKKWTTCTLLLVGALVFVALPASAQDFAGVPRNACQTDGYGGVGAVADLSATASDERSRSQDVSITDDNVLLAIALVNNGAAPISWNDLRDVDIRKDRTTVFDQTTDLDRDTVFSALALGHHATAGSLEALACVSDISRTTTESVDFSRTVDLDQDNVLLAIALANSAGGDLVFEDIASMDEDYRSDSTYDQTVDIEREDAFLSLALGAGGR